MNQSNVSDRAYANDRTRNGRETSFEETQGRKHSLWDRILQLLEEDLAEHRTKKAS
jgi:hypothetical protein